MVYFTVMIGINVSKFDKAAIELVSRLPPGLRPFFELISYIGHPITTSFIGFTIAVYGVFKQKPAIVLSGAFVWLALIISTIIKHAIERSRPLTEYVASMFVHSFSFPSGHTTGSTVAFGLLAYYGYHLLPSPFSYIAVVALILLILLVGVSRVYLGAHYPTDVIGGWALGAVVLGIVIFVIKPL
jgi:membrane-associated phospholipid phosphatase